MNKPFAADCPAVRAKAHAASAQLQARTRANNAATPADRLRNRAAEKQASAQLLLKAHDQRCKTYPHTRMTAHVVALWEGHYALMEKARELLAEADALDALAAPQLPHHATAHITTHRVTAAA